MVALREQRMHWGNSTMYIENNAIKIHYSVRGTGLPVLFLHAFPLAGAMWEPQRTMLEHGFRVIVPDLRGFGKSDVPTEISTMDVMVDDMQALLRQLDLDKVVLVGLSMGGYIAFQFLRRFPGQIHALVLADTRATSDTAEAQAGRETMAKLAETAGAAAIAEQMLPRLLGSDATSEVRQQVRQMIEATHPQGIAAALRGMAVRLDATDLLGTIRVPTLLLGGEQDTLTPPATMQAMQNAIDGSSLTLVPGAGHLPNLEQPEVFNTTLLKFLQRL